MRITLEHIILLLLLIIRSGSSCSQQTDGLSKVEGYIFLGEFNLAKSKLNNIIESSSSNKTKAQAFYWLGYVYKQEGDIEQTLVCWEKSNKYRSKAFPHDYHIAWNYALLSNYHYEKINTALAVQYADSCLQLISRLTLAQQKEIEVYKIWNILGQSYKQSTAGLSFELVEQKYKQVQGFYLKSVNFIRSNHIKKHYLAETYRLLGNSFLDLTSTALASGNSNALVYYQNSTNYYNQSTIIWEQLYGNGHFELAKTLFVHGLLNFYANNQLGFNSLKRSICYFEQAFKVYNHDINNIPNKESCLMTCKYLTLAYLQEFKRDASKLWLNKAENVNQIAIKVWENIHLNYYGKNTNQNLAIYSLVPFSETISIELLKGKTDERNSMEIVFSANQKLKYYDLLKNAAFDNRVPLEISISELQQRLKKDEIFLDFHIASDEEAIVILKITNQSCKLIKLPNTKKGVLEEYLKAIETVDFDSYTKTAYKIYQEIIKPCQVGNNKLILCLDGFLNSIPFEALLTSKTNWFKRDYRKLDYLMMQNRLQYVLNPQLFRQEKHKAFEFSIEAFIPDNQAYTSLPFSQRLGKNLQSKFNAQIHLSSSSTKNKFLKMNSSIVHLSGHGVISGNDMLNSYLIMSDSLLYLDDLSRLGNAPSLIALNTCNSANGKLYYGEGVNGFVRALNMLGTRSIISNLWEVDDQASNQLLEQFYELLREGKSTTESLYLAQIGMIQKARNSNLAAPYYWAGHRLTGDEIEFEQEKTKVHWILLILFGVAVIFLLKRLRLKKLNVKKS